MSDSEVEPWVEVSRVMRATTKNSEKPAAKEEDFLVYLCSVAPAGD